MNAMRRRLIKQPTYGTCCHQSTHALSSTMQSVPMHKFRSAAVQTAPLRTSQSLCSMRKKHNCYASYILSSCLCTRPFHGSGGYSPFPYPIQPGYVPGQLCKICGVKFGPRIGFILSTSVFPYQHHSTIVP